MLFLETVLPTAKSQLKPAFNKYTLEIEQQYESGGKTNPRPFEHSTGSQ